MKITIFLTLILAFNQISWAQNRPNFEINNTSIGENIEYAYITIQGKSLSKKLLVDVDLGDSPEQINQGKKMSEILTNKKSYAAILNHMSNEGFELATTLALSAMYGGVGGTEGVVFIMKKIK
ncbi:MAG: hypothetical protein ACTHYC_14580 [Sphingobacterium sp.]